MSTSGKPPSSIASELTSVTELFHRVNSVIPDEQELVTVEPEMAVADALDLLQKYGFSQMPVVVGRAVGLVVFSGRGVRRGLALRVAAAVAVGLAVAVAVAVGLAVAVAEGIGVTSTIRSPTKGRGKPKEVAITT